MWGKLKQWAARVRRDTLALWFAVRDPRTPRWLRWFGFLIIAYALSPVDLIPDFIPLIGYLDELILLPAGLWLMIRHMPGDVLTESRKRADDWLAAGKSKPRSALGAIIVIAIWVTIVWWLIAIFAPTAIAGASGSQGFMNVNEYRVGCMQLGITHPSSPRLAQDF